MNIGIENILEEQKADYDPLVRGTVTPEELRLEKFNDGGDAGRSTAALLRSFIRDSTLYRDFMDFSHAQIVKVRNDLEQEADPLKAAELRGKVKGYRDLGMFFLAAYGEMLHREAEQKLEQEQEQNDE